MASSVPLLFGEEQPDSCAPCGRGDWLNTSTDSFSGDGGKLPPQPPKPVSGYWSEGSSNFTALDVGLEVEELPFDTEWQ